jgi:hypothetical protein
LQYQVDNRLQGAARAQVATRLAGIYLMNHKPDKAQAVLRATRTADLNNEIRVPRLMIDARALCDIGRHDFAFEVIAGLEGRVSLRLRSDIYWASLWQKAAEHIELLRRPMEELRAAHRRGRADMLRAGVAYSLAEDKLGAARLRQIRGQDGRGIRRPRLRRGHRRRSQGALSGDAGRHTGSGGAGGECAEDDGRCRADRLDPANDAAAISAR